MPWTTPRTWVNGEIPTATMFNAHVRDDIQFLYDSQSLVLPANAGTAGGLGERWYPCCVSPQSGTSGNTYSGTVALTVSTFFATPFIVPPITLDRLGIHVTTGSAVASNARGGIYQATSDTNLYPSALIVDAGTVSTTASGVKTFTISTALTAGVVYWAVILTDTLAQPVLAAIGKPQSPVGCAAPGALVTHMATGITRSQAFGALPGTFPAGPPTSFTGPGTTFALDTPLIAFRRSA